MHCNPEAACPDDPDAVRESTDHPQLTKLDVVAARPAFESRRAAMHEPTLTERVLMFLDRHAA